MDFSDGDDELYFEIYFYIRPTSILCSNSYFFLSSFSLTFKLNYLAESHLKSFKSKFVFLDRRKIRYCSFECQKRNLLCYTEK